MTAATSRTVWPAIPDGSALYRMAWVLTQRAGFGLRDMHASAITRWAGQMARPLSLTDRPVVVVAPHQDDETFGCGGLIALKRRMGAAVRVVFLTDGRRSHHFDCGVDTAALACTRQREMRAATQRLGILEHEVWNLEGPDGGLGAMSLKQRAELVGKLASLVGEWRGAEVLVPHRHDAHPDHEAAYALSVEAAAAAPGTKIIQYSIWMAWLRPLMLRMWPTDLAGAAWLSIRDVVEVKRAAMAAYGSQAAILPPGFLRRFAWPWELYFQGEN